MITLTQNKNKNMRHKKKTNRINYFEDVYLEKKGNEISILESKRLQKLLSVKALNNSVNSGGVTEDDLKKTIIPKTATSFTMDIDNFLLPFDL